MLVFLKKLNNNQTIFGGNLRCGMKHFKENHIKLDILSQNDI